MSGLVKPKQYDWKDSNLAMFGSDEEKKVSSLTRAKKLLKFEMREILSISQITSITMILVFMQLKKSAAMKEPAWTGCENFEGTKIWRIEKFKVTIIFLQFALVL